MAKSGSTTQVEMLKSLSQQSAAWLVDISARNLREKPDVPRNGDGSYDGRDLLKWASSRNEAVKLRDEVSERLLVAVEALTPEPVGPFVHLTAELKGEFGPNAYAIIGKAFCDYWAASYRSYPDDVEDPSKGEYDRGYADWLRQAEDQTARARLKLTVRCETCNRLRQGPRWINAATPGGYVVVKGLCPQCEADDGRTKR